MFKLDEKIVFEDKENDLLTVGEMLVDMISTEYSDDFECDSYKKHFGGSPANIAMNVKKLGIRSIIASAVGKDGLGRFLIKHLKDAELDASYVQEIECSTSMVLVTKSKESPVPIFYRAADYHLMYTTEFEKAIESSKIFHFSCWPISKQPVRATMERAIEKAKEKHTLVCFDPNFHPMIWEKGENGIEYVKSILKKVDIVKPSEDDAERLFGKDSNENQIEKFLKLGAKLVIMTLGKEGAIVSDGVETVRFDTMASEVIDTTGAGDAFWSGFYTGIIKGYTIRKALNLGFAVSAYKLKYTGAVVALPRFEEIESMYNL